MDSPLPTLSVSLSNHHGGVVVLRKPKMSPEFSNVERLFPRAIFSWLKKGAHVHPQFQNHCLSLKQSRYVFVLAGCDVDRVVKYMRPVGDHRTVQESVICYCQTQTPKPLGLGVFFLCHFVHFTLNFHQNILYVLHWFMLWSTLLLQMSCNLTKNIFM